MGLLLSVSKVLSKECDKMTIIIYIASTIETLVSLLISFVSGQLLAKDNTIYPLLHKIKVLRITFI